MHSYGMYFKARQRSQKLSTYNLIRVCDPDSGTNYVGHQILESASYLNKNFTFS